MRDDLAPRFPGAVPRPPAIARDRGATSTDIRIDEVRHGYEDYIYRAPYKFGGRVVDRVTLLNVRCRVTTRDGKTAWGFGSMTMGNMWAFPSKTMSYDTTLDAMKALAGRIAADHRGLQGDRPPARPRARARARVPEGGRRRVRARASSTSRSRSCARCWWPARSTPRCTTRSARCTAGTSTRPTGRTCCRNDLSRYLGPDFRGERLDRALLPKAAGAHPAVPQRRRARSARAKDVEKPVGDGLPETLPEWIAYNGLVRIKIKLSGEDLAWDVERTLAIDRVAAAAQARARA